MLSQALHGVDHGLSRWCHAAGKADDDTVGSEWWHDVTLVFLYLFIAGEDCQHVCVQSIHTDLRLAPTDSKPRQSLKADAPLLVYKNNKRYNKIQHVGVIHYRQKWEPTVLNSDKIGWSR